MTDIDGLLQGAVNDGSVPAVVAGFVTRDGTTHIFAHGQDAAGRPAHARSLFWIASMTKALTSVAALRLVERGLLPLDTPIGVVLPALRNRKILDGFDPDGRPVLREARNQMTLAHLLSHTSGFAENVWSAAIDRYVRVTGTPTGGSAKLAALDLPLLFEPGTSWHYGIGHDWVGQAIEAASGQRLDRHFAEHLFGPLGMTDTVYVPDAAQAGRAMTLTRRAPDGSLTPITRTLPATREFWSGGGTMHSTPADYLAFIAMLLREGAPVLSPETIAEMAVSRTDGMAVSWLDPAILENSNPVEFHVGRRKGWGLGTMVTLEGLPTGRRADSLEWAGLSNTYFWVDPAAGIGGVLMTQILPFADPAVMSLATRFEAAVYAMVG